MRYKLKFLGIPCVVAAAVLLVPVYAQAAGGAPSGAAPASATAVSDVGAGGAPPGVAPGGGAPAGMTPAAGGAPGGAPNVAGGAPSAGGGMPPGAEGTAATPVAPAESAAQAAKSQAQAAAAAAAAQKMAEQEAKDAAATKASALAADKVPSPPRPAYMVPLAARGLTLAVTRAGNHLVAVGGHGDIVTSTDGIHWTQMGSPVRQTLTAVTFPDANDGWAVGHDSVIIHSTDGGKTWKLQAYQPKLQSPLLNVFFLNAQHGFAMGAFGQLRETTDGGATWNDVTADNIRGPELNFYDMIMLGDGSLLIVGEQGTLDLSTDQGTTWQKLKSPYKGSFFGALPSGDQGALIFGLRGSVYITDNVGKGQWQTVSTTVTSSFFGGTELKDGSFVLVGARGAIMQISPDGSTVKPLSGPSSQDYDDALPFRQGLVLAGVSGMQWLKPLH